MNSSGLNQSGVNTQSRGWWRRAWSKWLGAAVPLLLLLVLLLSLALNSGFVFYPPLLFSALNITFVVLISLVVAYVAAHSFMATGQPQLAWLGGGALAFGFSALLSALMQTQLNVAITVHNLGALLASVLYVVGALYGLRSGRSLVLQRKTKAHVLIGIYAAGASLILLIMLLSLSGMMPTFFIPGAGGTLLRQVVVYSGGALFGISGLLLLLVYFTSRAGFLYWYSLGLILIALGLLTVSFIKIPGDIFAWLGRGSQYVGGIYLVIAVLTVVREARARNKSIEEVIADFSKQAKVNYELLVNSAADAIIAVDGMSRILMWNPAAERMFGYSHNEAIGRPFFDFTNSPEQMDSYKKAAEASSPERDNAGLPATMELKARRKNGEEFSVSLTLTRQPPRQRLPTTTLIIRDITERKKAEEALNYDAQVIRSIHDAIIVFDHDSIIRSWSKSAEELYGWTAGEVIGKNVAEVLQPRFPGGLTRPDVLRNVYDSGSWSGNVTHRKKDGGEVQAQVSASALKDARGNTTGVILVHHDVTDMKRADELMRFQSLLVDSTHDAIISSTLTPQGEFITRTWNKGAEALYGWRSEEVIGRPTVDFLQPEFPPPGTMGQYMKQFLEQGRWEGEVITRRKDGSKIVVLTSQTVLRDNSGNITGAVGVHHDITALKKAEDALQESEANFRNIYESSPIGIVLYDSGGKLISVSQAALGIMGSAVMPEDFNVFDDPNLTDELKTKLQSNETVHFQLAYDIDKARALKLFETTKTGIVYLDVLVTPLGDSNERSPGRYLVHFQDITGRKRVEEALHRALTGLAANEERLKRSQEIAHLGSWELDLVTDKLVWSDEVYRIFGLKPQEFDATYEAFLDAVHPDDRDAVDTAYSGSVMEGRDGYEMEHRIVRKSNREIRYVHEKCQHVRDESGKVVRSIGMVHDITERKKAEQALLESEERFFKAFHSSPIPLTVALLPEGRWVDVNDSFLTMLEYTRKEVIGRTSAELNMFPRTEERAQVLKVFLEKGALQNRELIVRTKTGKLLTVLSSNVKVSLNSREHAVSTIIDITDRKRAEEALQKNTAHARLLSETASILLSSQTPEAIVQTICDKVMAHLNCDVFFNYLVHKESGRLHLNAYNGIPVITAIGIEWLSFGKDVCGCAARDATRIVVENIQENTDDRASSVRSFGLQAYAAHPIVSRGKVIGTLSFGTRSRTSFTPDELEVMKSVTVQLASALERKRAEEEIQLERNRLVNILNSMEDGVCIIDRDFNLEYINPSLQAEFGSVNGRKCHQYFDNSDGQCPWCNNKEVFSGKTIRREETLGGTGKTYEIVDAPLRNVDGTNSKLVVFHDITERKKAEQIKDEFIGMVSHEIKTPLTVIIGALSVVGMKGLTREQTEELLKDAINHGDILNRIVDNLLELSRSQANRLVLQKEPVSVEQIARKVIIKLQDKSDKHRLTVGFPEWLPLITGDQVRLERILINLVDNAIKYSPDGGEVKVSARQDNNQLVVSVSDQGRGIPITEQGKLFRSFERLGAEVPGAIQGIGLGLNVCRILVEAHGGRIWVESETGRGSTFRFTVPVA